jgi:hypothetical protein
MTDLTTYSLASDFGANKADNLRHLVGLAARVRPLPVRPGEALLVGIGPYGPASAWLMGRGNLPALTAERLVQYRNRFYADSFVVIAFDQQSDRCLLGGGAGTPDAGKITAAAFGVIGSKDQDPINSAIHYGDGWWFEPMDPALMRPDDLCHHAGTTLHDYGRIYAREHLMRRAAAKTTGKPSKITIAA